MHVHYINLRRRTDRNDRFLELNRALVDVERIDAVDGRDIERDELARDGVMEGPMRAYTLGSLGNILSHKKLWERCVADGAPLTIAEDDAVFNRHFPRKSADLLASLSPDWDVVLWGWNFNAMLRVAIMDDLKHGVLRFDCRRFGPRISEFQDKQYDVLPLRLTIAFGNVCYSISPKGARRMLELCFPLRKEMIAIPGMRFKLPNAGLDVLMNKHYGNLQSYVCFPPLVWTENERSTSDIAVNGSWLRRALRGIIGKF